ncbi:MAG: hypothetical protein OXC48_04740, partial [Endozoicomonadaceae bacterium]|nr:hypothetical protein [Endozoicomonadaceae bacterium]
LFLLLFLSGIFTASAFGGNGNKKNSKNALEVCEQSHVGAINDQGYASKKEVTAAQWQAATSLTVDQQIELAEKEYQRRLEWMLCKVCKFKERDCVYLPCAHIVACFECGQKAQTCVDCSQNIKTLVKVVIS